MKILYPLLLALAATDLLPAAPQEHLSKTQVSPPRDITEITRRDPKALARLQKPGKLIFQADFEQKEALKAFFEVRGKKDGRASLVFDTKIAHRGRGSLRCIAPDRQGAASGSGASAWLGKLGYEQLYFRRYIRFAEDYDQGNLNHTGGGLAGVATDGQWDGMGKAGLRPRGDDRFSCAFEPWRSWGRVAAPGYLFLYTYWMDMTRDRDGNYWGNMLSPAKKKRRIPKRGRWTCLEQMIRCNDITKSNGECAAWIDGKLYLHMTGIRWRTSEKLRIKRFNIGIYIHQARRTNRVWYDDVALSTGYVGPTKDEPNATGGNSKD